MTVNGLDEFYGKINDFARKNKTQSLCRYAVYGGAKVIGDSIYKGIEGIPTEENHYVNTSGKITNQYAENPTPPTFELMKSVSPEIKDLLLDNFGISDMFNENGKICAVIGFHGGYLPTHLNRKHPGVPIVMVARSIESGSSVREKHPFVRPAVKKAKTAAQAEMSKRVDEYIKGFDF